MALLEVTDITVGYGDAPILQQVSIHVHSGEIVALVGPNGAGKSTLMKTVAGLLKPRQGTVRFADRDLAPVRPHQMVRLGLGYVPQVDNVFPSLSIAENLDMGAFIARGNIQAKKAELYALFPDLYAKRHTRAAHLSGGQRQMLAMARALMLDPTLLLLDEPTAGLSPAMVTVLLENIVAINGRGVAVLMVEQNARQALHYANRAYVLVAGHNRYEDTGQALLANPEMRALFLGG